MSRKNSPRNRTRIAQGILYFVAALALLAGVGSLSTVTQASAAVVVAELWRTIGFFTFAALFAFLAYNPRVSKVVWVIIIGNKLALFIAGLFLMGDTIAGASDLVIFDGGLAVLLVVASILAGTWQRETK
jgi:hypothetical protein